MYTAVKKIKINWDEARNIEILLVEDNEPDIDLTKEALEEFHFVNNLHIVKDGEDALDFLYKKKQYKDAPDPDLILLDLNLPKKDGLEVLAEIKTKEELKVIPVVILTTSEAEEDIIKSYKLHANCYITKPLDLNQFLEVIKTFGNFWLSIAKYPDKKRILRGD
jgi:CheY-like chemotaxis protein